MSGIQMLIIILMIVALVFFLLDVRKWNSLQSLINRKVKILRAILLFIVEALLVLFLLKERILEGDSMQVQLSYWSSIVALAFAVVVVALLDVREVIWSLRKMNKDIFQSIKEDKNEK